MSKKLRSGYTTGACAAAAARAACTAVLLQECIESIEVTFPEGSVVIFKVTVEALDVHSARAYVIKDAGDDPDVTNGAMIAAEVLITRENGSPDNIFVEGGTGVGMVTKPGLAVDVGLPAINPVPMKMIKQNIQESLNDHHDGRNCSVQVSIIVPDGIKLAQKTLNARLGIIGGISILGTTGIVRPISAQAWTATIKSSLDVAQANGVEEIVFSTGRTSERCIQSMLAPPEEALVMMGDYLHYSLKEVRNYSFTKIHMATMWAKLLKGAIGYEQTHVRHGVLDTAGVCEFFLEIGVGQELIDSIKHANTAREILEILRIKQAHHIIESVCDFAVDKYARITGKSTAVHLVDGRGNLICTRDI